MTSNPYTPPRHDNERVVQSSWSLFHSVSFVLNFSFATFFFVACVVSVAAGDNPFALLGGIIAVIPVACYAVAEWICWYRKHFWLLRPLGIANLLLAAFFVFGLVTTIGEAFMADDPVDPVFILLFGFGFSLIAGYLGYCGWRRIHALPSPIVPSLPIQSGQ